MSAGAKILVITSGSLSRNPRPAKEAATLARAGYAVTVLHPGEGPHYDRLDVALAAAGGYRDETVPSPAVPGFRLARRLQRWLARRAVPLGFETAAALGDGADLLARARALPADLTIVHNEVPLWVGHRLLREGRRVAADIEDWYSEDLLPNERRHRPLRLLQKLERTMLHEAAHVTTTSQALAAALHERHGGHRAAVITNSFPLQPDPRTRRPDGDAEPAFFWFSQTIGPGRGLESFLDVWARIPAPSRLVLLGEPRPGFPEHLRALLPVALRARLAVQGLVPPADLASVIARHDIGLALEESAIPSRNLTITNKALQYLNAGLALAATDTAGQREVLHAAPAAGLLLPRDDPAASARKLEAWLCDRRLLRAAQAAARVAAEKIYCWELEAPRLLAAVSQALAAR